MRARSDGSPATVILPQPSPHTFSSSNHDLVVDSPLAVIEFPLVAHVLCRKLRRVLRKPSFCITVASVPTEGAVPRGRPMVQTVAVGTIHMFARGARFQSVKSSLDAVLVDAEAWVISVHMGE